MYMYIWGLFGYIKFWFGKSDEKCLATLFFSSLKQTQPADISALSTFAFNVFGGFWGSRSLNTISIEFPIISVNYIHFHTKKYIQNLNKQKIVRLVYVCQTNHYFVKWADMVYFIFRILNILPQKWRGKNPIFIIWLVSISAYFLLFF